MNTMVKQTTLALFLAAGTVISTGTSAQAACGLDCWLRNTFSTNDFVGDWLRDTFGPIRDQSGSGGEERITENLVKSDEIVNGWKPGKEILDPETAMMMRPKCKLPQLVEVVNAKGSPEALLESCFSKR